MSMRQEKRRGGAFAVIRPVTGRLVTGSLAVALALMLVLALAPGRPGMAADGFVEGFADLPLMPGLEQIRDASLAFDATSGRIVVAFARGPLPVERIRAFYAETLAQLGWTGAGRDDFRREGESLMLDYTPDGGEILVRYSLLPR